MVQQQFPGQRPPDWQPPEGARKKGTPTWLIVVGVLGGLLVLGSIAGGGGDRPEAKKESPEKGAQARPAIEATAAELHAAYSANEVAAQARYGAGPINVSGKIAAIELDFADDPVVRFDVGKPYEYVSASFPEEAAQQTAALAKGQKLTVRCASIGEVAGTPMLRDCALAP